MLYIIELDILVSYNGYFTEVINVKLKQNRNKTFRNCELFSLQYHKVIKYIIFCSN